MEKKRDEGSTDPKSMCTRLSGPSKEDGKGSQPAFKYHFHAALFSYIPRLRVYPGIPTPLLCMYVNANKTCTMNREAEKRRAGGDVERGYSLTA